MLSRKNMLKRFLWLLVASATGLASWCDLSAQVTHSYPRTAVFHFGNDAPAYWYAKFDLVDVRSTRTSLPKAIKAINPNTYVFGTKDWNNGSFFKPTPDEYKTYRPNGQAVFIYGSTTNNFTVNFSDYCKRINGKRYNEALPQATLDLHDQRFFDGIATDGLWIKPREAEKIGEIDLDRNGKNDYDEHGKSWVNSTWKAGVDKVIAEINRLNNNRPLIINSGRFHEPEFYWEESNGMVLEMTAFIPQIDWFKNIYQSWMKKARQPHLLIMDGLGSDKEAYQHMRYLLGMTLFGDGYYCFSDNSLHHYHYYYDEFDTDLGQPTTDVQLIRPDGPNARGVYVRFFTKGAVIINASERNQVVSDADISSASGYNGPYFRFAGGQDPGFNSGGRFNSVQLSGKLNSKNRVIGDAILLTKQQVEVVADIVVDNNERGTNPGSQPATFSGNWTLDNDNNEDSWALSYRGRNGDWAVAYAPAGGGAATATFTPTIGRPGKYHVYEWHGRILGRPAATNAPYEIRHTAGTTKGRINQSVGQGRWNYLGEFNFAKGRNNYVRISNDANGVVLADAFMFVYKEAMLADNQAPQAPQGIRVTQ